MRKSLVLLALLVFTVSATATSISEEEVEVDLDTLEVEHEITFNDITADRMTYIVNHPVNNLYVEIEGEEADCEFEELGIGGEVSCATEHEENFDVFMSYRTSDLIEFEEGVNTFRWGQNIYRPTDSYTLRAVLPEGGALLDSEEASEPSIEPEHGETGSEGRRIFVEWNEEPNLETLSYSVRYEELDRGFTTLILALLVLTVAAGVIYRYSYSSRPEEPQAPELSEDQKKVVDTIKEQGSVLQKDLVDQMDYSKAKISGLVSELEEKEMVEKEKEGRSNRLYLKD